jgi:hypothetical protein
MVQNIAYSFDAGVARSIKTGASPLEINDGEFAGAKTALASDPVSSQVRRIKNKVNNIAGVTKSKVMKSFSTANKY